MCSAVADQLEPPPRTVSDVAQRAGRAIAARRSELGLRQHEVATAAGLTRSSVANIEAGRQEPTAAALAAMAAKLETTVGALLGEQPRRPAPETWIAPGWVVRCERCGPVAFVAEHEEARAVRSAHVGRDHEGAPDVP